MYKINLYTTKGCDACIIMEDNINKAIDHIKDVIIVNVLDKEYCWREMLKAEGVTDFPTMIFYIDDKMVLKLTGIYQVDSIRKLVNIRIEE